jgi:hypothetical protein
MASEDSDQVVPGFLAVHGLRDLDDLDETLRIEMPAGGDKLHTVGKRFEVVPLRCSERVLLEERNNDFQEIRAPIDAVLQEVVAVVVTPSISSDSPHPEEAMELLEADDARCALRDSEAMTHLVAGSVSVSALPVWLPVEADWEAAFSVYKTNNPASVDQPFLLIFRTVRIVTEHRTNLCRVPDGYTGFSSI